MSSSNVRARRREDRRIWRNALLGSILFHVLVFVASGRRPVPTLAEAAAGPNAADLRAARGVQTMRIAFPPPRPLTPPAIPIPTEIEVETVDLDAEVDFDLAALLGEPDLPGPPGLVGDRGGDGGSGSEGLGGFSGPRPLGQVFPPSHKELRKGPITVWTFVNESGRVVADSTYLDPPTRNKKLNRQLIKEAADWRFYPATQDGKPVSAWASYTIRMG